MCIKMRRAIRIREFFRAECMRYKMIDASHHKMIYQIFLQSHALIPAIISKDFAHGISFFLWLYCRCGTGKFTQKIMVKFPVSMLEHTVIIGNIFALREYLPSNIIYACHILSGQPPEVMPQRRTRAGMVVIIFNQMADIPDSMAAAPISYLYGKVLFYQVRHCIHIQVTHLCR